MFKSRNIVKKETKRRETSSSSSESERVVLAADLPDACPVKKKRRGIGEAAGREKDNFPKQVTETLILSADDAFRASLNMRSDIKEMSHSGLASSGQKPGILGPSRQASNLRSTSRFDYQMDVCKDFKETGYCGFGDSCKFLHDRSEYKTGWELEREWDAKQREVRASVSEEESDPKSVCGVCRRTWQDCASPACVSTCGHFFCEKCFMENCCLHCAVCGKCTDGIFNSV